jgi:tetratricopeptide (TPR) repeat protein
MAASVVLSGVIAALTGPGFLASPAAERATEPSVKAPLFNDLGDFRRKVTTKSNRAQRYFDQGLILAYGFNHREAGRSFREAARLDPGCGMCWWGAALVLGPNYNAPMSSEDVRDAWEFVQKARQAAEKATPVERALIEALAKRYAAEPAADRRLLDEAYAEAMREVARRFPDDLDAATLFAEALMNLHPWDLYAHDGAPKPWTPEILSVLERVLARNPDHIGAIHFYIHATEASNEPRRAEKYADRLGRLAPGAGHLVHMPSHTYIRTGRYLDAMRANERATKADESYISQCRAQGLYPLAYVPHNWHFLWASASLAGNSAAAIRAALETDSKVHREHMAEMGSLQHYSLLPLFAYLRFGRWEQILAAPAPADGLPYRLGVWHYARGLAFARSGRVEEATNELSALKRARLRPDLERVTIWDINPAEAILAIAEEALAGEVNAARGRYDRAVRLLRRAVRLEDALKYQEPSDWHFPARHALGAVLLEAGRPAEAEDVYREDLRRNPDNGWSLFGLARSLEAQGKKQEAAEAQARFRKAWAHADVRLSASRF